MNRFREIFQGLWFWRLLALAVASVCAFMAVWWGGLNQDEGWYLYAAQLVRAGRLPYRDFFFTQGPAMPFVYSALAPLWSQQSPLHGLLGGRIATLAIGLAATLAACGTVRRLVPAERRGAASLALFALLSGNLYHVYFTTIPKTYALGSLFLAVSFLFLAAGLGIGRAAPPACVLRIALLSASGLSAAFASGTRISLLLAIPATGAVLLAFCRRRGLAFLWYALGAGAGLFLVYGGFALDPSCRAGLLAAQEYHAARGETGLFFMVGAVSRLARGYAALGVALFAAAAIALFRPAADGAAPAAEDARPKGDFVLAVAVSFFAVLALQMSAPYPYDDYQVPVMGLLATLVCGWFFGMSRGTGVREAAFAALVSGLVSFSSPLLQQWTVYGQDRFWAQPKERSELSKLRFMAEEINLLDPGGDMLLTQDLYLAVEAGRKVPDGFEMGPFSYFPDLPESAAKSRHVVNTEMLERLLRSAPCEVAAFSGYAFAITAPTCKEVPFERQKGFFRILKENYEVADTEPNFGQNATTLLVLRRKSGTSAEAKAE